MYIIPVKLSTIKKQHPLRPVLNEASLLASVTVEQPIIQAVISSLEMLGGTKSKFQSLIAYMENAAQITEHETDFEMGWEWIFHLDPGPSV